MNSFLKRTPADAAGRSLLEAVLESEVARESEQQEREQRQREYHDELHKAAAERRKRILNRP